MTYVIVNKSYTQNLANRAICSLSDLSDMIDMQKVFFDGHLRNFEIVGYLPGPGTKSKEQGEMRVMEGHQGDQRVTSETPPFDVETEKPIVFQCLQAFNRPYCAAFKVVRA